MTRFDRDGFKAAIEGKDLEKLLGFYAADAELTIVDNTRPPSSPTVLRGGEVTDLLDATYAQEMTHQVQLLVYEFDFDQMAFTEACEYGDGPYEGTKVLSNSVARIGPDGRIWKQLTVQAWDQ